MGLKNFLARQLFGATLAPTDTFIKNVYNNMNANNGVYVTEETALTYSAVYACVRNISETIATLPIRVHDKSGTVSTEDTKHPLNYLISTRPNENVGKIAFVQNLMSAVLLWGNGYAVIKRNGLRPISLDLKHPSLVTPLVSDGKVYYAVAKKDKEGKKDFDLVMSSDMIHIQGVSTDGISGISPIQSQAETIGLGMSATKYGKNFFDNGANASGVLEHPANLSEPAIDRLKKQFAEQYSGLNGSNKTMIFEEGMKYNRISIPPNDAQMIETRKYQVEDIARIFRVQLIKIQSHEQSSYNSIEQENINWTVDSLRPWIKKLEEEFTYKLFRTSERGVKTIDINMTALLRGDATSRANYYTKLFQVGALSPNDIRKMEGFNLRTDKAGDDFYVPSNLANESNPRPDGE